MMTTDIATVDPAVESMLARVDEWERQLATENDIGNLIRRDGGVQVVRDAMKALGYRLEARNRMAAFDLRQQRRLGEIIRAIPKLHGARPPDAGSHDVTPYAELGIRKMQASRWQGIAYIPEDRFEKKIGDVCDAERELTTSTMLALWRKIVREEKQADVASSRRQQPRVAKFYERDAIDFLTGVDSRTIDLLLTDPPYSTEFPDPESFDLFLSWIRPALDTVKDTGRAFICAGAFPRELHAYLRRLIDYDRLIFEDVLVWTYENTLGPTPAQTFKNNWQAIFHLYGKDAPPLDSPLMLEQFSVMDIPAPDGRLGDRWHSWQKPEDLADRLVRLASKPGDIVIDPFAGTGTFCLVAAQLGRIAVGCDTDPEALAIAVERGGELVDLP